PAAIYTLSLPDALPISGADGRRRSKRPRVRRESPPFRSRDERRNREWRSGACPWPAPPARRWRSRRDSRNPWPATASRGARADRSEEHTSELQSRENLV